MKLTTIFSTGDAGAARGALEAADDLRLKVGGWTAAPGLPAVYTERLRSTLAPRMAARLNVQDSDGTLIVSFSTSLAAGSPAAYADEAAGHQRKASLHLVLPDGGRSAIPEDVRKGVLAWIDEEKIATLHVTGPREAEEPGIQQAVRDALVWIFEDEVEPRAAISPANVDVAIAAGLDVRWRFPTGAGDIVATVDVACPTCIRLCFDGARSKPNALVRAGVAHATPLDGPDVPLCEHVAAAAIAALVADSDGGPMCPTCGERMVQIAGAAVRAVVSGGLLHVAALEALDGGVAPLCAYGADGQLPALPPTEPTPVAPHPPVVAVGRADAGTMTPRGHAALRAERTHAAPAAAPALGQPWTRDNWLWCGCAGPHGRCPNERCTNHKDAPHP